jgi:hypothetical protein
MAVTVEPRAGFGIHFWGEARPEPLPLEEEKEALAG